MAMAASAASAPLPDLLRAWSMVSQVRSPNPIGWPVSPDSAARAPATALPSTSWWVVSPRTIAPSTIRASGFFGSERAARAAAGSSKAPGTRTTQTSEPLAPQRSRVSSALASSASVIVGFQRAHSTRKRSPDASSPPSTSFGWKAGATRRETRRLLKERLPL
jgi:hypothetical protein